MSSELQSTAISSPLTGWYKFAFPVVWFLLTALIAGELAYLGLYTVRKPPVGLYLIPVGMVGIGLLLIQRLTRNLADKVLDSGDRLIVTKGGQRREIPLASILNVSHSIFSDPIWIRLLVRDGDRAVNEITFCPVRRRPDYFDPMRNTIAEDLLRRIHNIPS